MSLFNVLSTASSALNAQTVRLNLTASNLANSESVAADEGTAYRARHPVFAAMLERDLGAGGTHATGVRVAGIVDSEAPLPRQYQPNHPLADDDGYVIASNVNAVEEMADMISASRAYQNSVEVMNTSKEMLLRTLSLGR